MTVSTSPEECGQLGTMLRYGQLTDSKGKVLVPRFIGKCPVPRPTLYVVTPRCGPRKGGAGQDDSGPDLDGYQSCGNTWRL